MNHYIKYLILLVTVYFFISCNEIKKEYYGNGTVWKESYLKNGKLNGIYREYYENGNLRLIHHYSNGKNIDSSTYFYPKTNENVRIKKYWFRNDSYYKKEFYPNGRIKEEGIVLDSNIRIKKWKFYNNNGVIEEIREYKRIEGKTYLNQSYNLKRNGDTLYYGSNFVRILLSKDTVKLNEPLRVVVFLMSGLFKTEESEIRVLLPINKKFTKDFSNQDIIELQTFNNLSIDTINQKWYKDSNYKMTSIFGKWFDSIGSKNIRGYVSEFYKKEPTKKDSSIMEERRIYFDFPIYVKDSFD